jgi:hypothetical protein
MKSPGSFLNTPDEWHSFVIGASEAFCLFIPPLFRRWAPFQMVKGEYWYYMFGRAWGLLVGVLTWLGVGKLALTLF